jgi:hypothetical protein
MSYWYDRAGIAALAEHRIFPLAFVSEIIVHGAMASAQEIIDAAGISRTHAYDIIAKREAPSLKVAFDIYDGTGEKFGILEGLDEGTIEKLRPKAAA